MKTDSNPATKNTDVPDGLADVLDQLPAEARELVLAAIACSAEELHDWMTGAAGPAPVPVRVARPFSETGV
jgi:hypothetical protein